MAKDVLPSAGKARVLPIDPFDASLRYLLVVIFPKSNSKNFPIALNIAEGAERFAIADISGKPTHLVCFGKSESDAGRAVALLDYIETWKGVQVFSRGKLIKHLYTVKEVLGCFMEAEACKDPAAHCFTVIDDPFTNEIENRSLSISIRLTARPTYTQKAEIDRFLFPCQLLYRRFRFQKDHPATPENQIQAAAVHEGCSWCPNFDPSNWKKVGVREVIKEFFE